MKHAAERWDDTFRIELTSSLRAYEHGIVGADFLFLSAGVRAWTLRAAGRIVKEDDLSWPTHPPTFIAIRYHDVLCQFVARVVCGSRIYATSHTGEPIHWYLDIHKNRFPSFDQVALSNPVLSVLLIVWMFCWLPALLVDLCVPQLNLGFTVSFIDFVNGVYGLFWLVLSSFHSTQAVVRGVTSVILITYGIFFC